MLYVFGGIVAIIVLLLLIPLSLTIRIDGTGELSLCLRVLGFRAWRIPAPPRPVRLRNYSPRAQKRKAKKKVSKKTFSTLSRPQSPDKETPLSEKISFVSEVVRHIFSRMLSHTRVKIIRLAITVASSDAANTALLYGAVSPAVAFLLETLEQFTHLKIASNAPVGVQADFTAQQCRADVHLRFRWRVIHLLDILFRTTFHMISNQSKHSS